MNKTELNNIYNDSVARIILNDGKGNVLDSVMMEELQVILNDFRKRPGLKLIVIEGGGKNFSFGASVEEHQKEFAEAMIKNFHRMLLSLNSLSIPSLAKVSGQCLGGGLELALMCHQIFADKTAKLGQPEINLGVFPPPASVLLPEKIGLSRAEDLLISGRSVPAEEAFALGLVNRLYESKEELEKGVLNWIEEFILPKSASSLRIACMAARAKFNHVVNNFIPQVEHLYLSKLMDTHDANEGIEAFLAKRKPEWTNA